MVQNDILALTWKGNCFTPAEELLKSSFSAGLGEAGWLITTRKRNVTTCFALHFIRVIMLVLFKASLSVIFCQYISNPASSGTSQLNPKFTCQSIPSMCLPYSGAKFFSFLGLVQEERLTINNNEDLYAGN